MKLEITKIDKNFAYVRGKEENDEDVKFMEKYNNKEDEYSKLPLHYRHGNEWYDMVDTIYNLVNVQFNPMGGVHFPEDKIFKVPLLPK